MYECVCMKKKNVCRKGQIQIGETIFIVIIVVLLLIFGMIFYAQAQKGEFIAQESEMNELDTIALSQITSSLSELQCSIQGVKPLSCFDVNKLTAFVRVREKNPLLTEEYYFSQLHNARIRVTQLYSSTTSSIPYEWLIYNNTYYENTIFATAPVIMPVVLYNPVTDVRSFGLLEIYKYSRVRI